jgi:uncharacterized protein (DUF3084 family)
VNVIASLTRSDNLRENRQRKIFLFWFKLGYIYKTILHPGKLKEKLSFFNLKNFQSMVQTDISQLSAECTEWRQILRNYREEFHQFQKVLQQTCNPSLSKNQMLQVEHLDNQLHIQLINIHDLKQQIKQHERTIQAEGDQIAERTYALHERLLNEFLSLENTLQELRSEFNGFVNDTACL